jgi:hypothetical protein
VISWLKRMFGSSWKVRGNIKAKGHHEQLQQALDVAESMLGMLARHPIKVITAEGSYRSHAGWLGQRVANGTLGGQTSPRGVVSIFLTNGAVWLADPAEAPAVHELAHAILYQHGVPTSEHHLRMRRAGFRGFYD